MESLSCRRLCELAGMGPGEISSVCYDTWVWAEGGEGKSCRQRREETDAYEAMKNKSTIKRKGGLNINRLKENGSEDLNDENVSLFCVEIICVMAEGQLMKYQ